MKIVKRDLDRKRFSGEDMARFARFLTNSSRPTSLYQLSNWFDGPVESGRNRTIWKSRRFKKHMKKTLKNSDVITTETIGDKIRRIAATPHVVRNRRLLKAMHYITQREDAEMTFTNNKMVVNGGTKNVIAVVATIAVAVDTDKGRWHDIRDDQIIMFPLNAYDPVTNEPPTIRE